MPRKHCTTHARDLGENALMSLRAMFVVAAVLICIMIATLSSPVASRAATPMPMTMSTAKPTVTSTLSPDQVILTPDSAPASPVSGTDWSIFNHRGAGVFVFLWGLTAFIAGLQWPRKTWFRFVPPFALFGLAEFLFLRNDPKTWPIGPIGFWYSFQDPAVFQHRIFVLLIIAIGVVELLRAADRLPPLARQFAVPGLAVVASLLLLFHQHGGFAMQQAMRHMSDPSMPPDPSMSSMLASMKIIKSEHLWFAILGLGLAAAKVLADTGRLPGRLGATLWPAFAVLFGIYMFTYTE